jgi:hypothetical protein
MRDLFFLKRDLMKGAELGALAILKLQNPSFDDVNYREACEIAGRRWLDFHIKKGNIKGTRRGIAKNSPIYFSRLEIAALKRAEAELEGRAI